MAMKVIKPIKIPMDIIIQELRNGEPQYIEAENLKVNLYDVAATLLTGMASQLDEAKTELAAFQAIIRKNTYINKEEYPQQDHYSIRAKHYNQSDSQCAVPVATVIAAIARSSI